MLNNVVLVGRIVDDPSLKNFEGDFVGSFITLAVSRPFRNFENKVETDFIRVVFWDGLAESICSYTHKGDIIGVRGRLAMRKIEIKGAGNEEPKVYQTIDVIGERLSFISKYHKKTNNEIHNDNDEYGE